jgi:hypothetical protein
MIFQAHDSALAAEISVALVTSDVQPVEDGDNDELPPLVE